VSIECHYSRGGPRCWKSGLDQDGQGEVRIDELECELQSSASQIGQLQREFQTAQDRADKLERDLRTAQDRIDKVERDLQRDKVGRDLQKVQERADEVERDLQQASNEVERLTLERDFFSKKASALEEENRQLTESDTQYSEHAQKLARELTEVATKYSASPEA
jgi:chromosome segregation ATPase